MKWSWWPFGRRRVATGDPARVAQAEAVLAELRPRFRADGGDVTLLGVDGGRVRVELRGACRSCAASVLTLKGALEPRLREQLDWFERLDS
ncbi:NifU family protein [Engelhardtia mirabilis]|uniref:NifU-like domain protein n=1 Tax=Engelhardtia mirabilis TaxID=2528011 RepID=A0A518BKP3_9BACT|nr:NifU-like domain protein [Planctomycetes bacterium Pla133]QDV01865.1 NifU-like domain protein [Planctomycetes bacterium Pla86]